MKFIAPKYKIENLIILADSIIENKVSSIIFSNIVLEVKENNLIIMASDSQIYFKAMEEVEVVEEGKILLNSKKISDIIKVLPDEEIEFVSDENYNITIKPTNPEMNIKFNLKGIVEEEFDINVVYDEEKLIEFDFNLFKNMTSKVLFATALSDKHYTLNGVLLEKFSNKISLVATDKRRLAYCYQFREEIPDIQVLVPKKFFSEILKIKSVSEKFYLGIEENRIIFKIDNIILISTLFELNFPDYKKIINSNSIYEAVIDVKELLSKLRTISVLLNSLEDGVIFNFDMDKLMLYTKESEVGMAEDTMSVEYRQDPVSISLMYNNIADLLKSIDFDKIKFGISENKKMVVIRPFEENKDFNYLYLTVTIIE